jgi:thiol:disulfide interchange protein DsbA
MKKLLTLLALLLVAPASFAAIEEGVQYQKVLTPQPTSGDGKIEVLEMFWYGCPHCYHLEPELNAWLEKKPDDVEFVRLPAVLGPKWELLARGYYTAELLGVLDKIHEPLFERIHKQHKPVRNVEELKAFFESQGVSGDDFDKTYNSFAVVTRTNRAKEAHNKYGVTGVPTLIVDGKYRTSASMAGSNKKLLEVVDFLIEKERQAATGATPEAVH